LATTIGDDGHPSSAGTPGNRARHCPLGRTPGTPLDRTGRVIVDPDLTVPGFPQVFVVGDMAAATSAKDSRPVPGLDKGAIQMGRHAGRTISGEVKAGVAVGDRRPFSYRDKGSMATIGRWRAVAEIGRARLGGPVAFLLWAVAHIASPISVRNRMAVAANWVWQRMTATRGARLITGEAALAIKVPLPDDRVHPTGLRQDTSAMGNDRVD